MADALETAQELSMDVDNNYDPNSIFNTEGNWMGGYAKSTQEDL